MTTPEPSAPDDQMNFDLAVYEMLAWAYSKLHSRTFNDMDDALMLDSIKLFLIVPPGKEDRS